MKVSKNTLRKIIREALQEQALPKSKMEQNWEAWGEGHGLFPEYDNEGQLMFYFELDDDVDRAIQNEAEDMGGSLEPTSMGAVDGNMVIYTDVYTSNTQ